MKNPHKTFSLLGIIVAGILSISVITNLNGDKTTAFSIVILVISLILVLFLLIGMKYKNILIHFIILFLSIAGLNIVALVASILGLSNIRKNNENNKMDSLDEVICTSKTIKILFIISVVLSFTILLISSYFIIRYIPSNTKEAIDNIINENPYFPLIEVSFIFVASLLIFTFPIIIEIYSIYITLACLKKGTRRKYMMIVPIGIFSISIFNAIGAIIALNKTKSNECDEKMQK